MANKKLMISLVVFVIALVFFVIVRMAGGDEDTWLCQNGQWVRHGYPSAPQPTTPCPGQSQIAIVPEGEVIVVTPKVNDIISSPLMIEGQAKGNWFFEASFPVKLVDDNGNQLAQIAVWATQDWTTADYVPFQGEMTFSPGLATTGKLIFQNDNPSSLPQNQKSFEVPVQFSPPTTETMTVKVYFNNDKLDPEISCNKVFSIERQVPKTEAVARAAVEELLKGPSLAERQQGYFTNINPGVKIQSLIIDEQGMAKIDFDEQIQNQVGGSCRVSAIRAEITETLKQFPTVKSVTISINGESDTILQP